MSTWIFLFLPHFVSIQFNSIQFNSIQFVSFRFVSFRFVSFRFVSVHFVSFRFTSFQSFVDKCIYRFVKDIHYQCLFYIANKIWAGVLSLLQVVMFSTSTGPFQIVSNCFNNLQRCKLVFCVIWIETRGNSVWEHGWRMRLARCLSALSSKVKPGRTGLQLDGWPPGYSLVLIVELGTYVSRVVDLSRALRVFLRVLRFSSLRKINTYQ